MAALFGLHRATRSASRISLISKRTGRLFMHSFFSFKARAFGPPLTFASARSFSRSSIIISPPSLGSRLAFEWMHGRWVVADPTDICKSSDFLHVLDMADKLATRLNNFSTDLDRRSRAHCDRTPLISWFALRRSAPSSWTHGDTRRFSLGASTHWERRHRRFASLGGFTRTTIQLCPDSSISIWEQLATQSMSQQSPDEQEDYCSKAFRCIMLSFISGLKGEAVSLSHRAT